MITEVISINAHDTVGDAMALYEEKGIRGAPVVNDQGELLGLLTLGHILRHLIPEAAILEDQPRLKHVEVSLENIHGTMEGVVKNLTNLKKLKVEEVMVEPDVVHPDMPLREGIRLIERYGSPIPVLEDDKSNKLVAVLSSQSILSALNKEKLEDK